MCVLRAMTERWRCQPVGTARAALASHLRNHAAEHTRVARELVVHRERDARGQAQQGVLHVGKIVGAVEGKVKCPKGHVANNLLGEQRKV